MCQTAVIPQISCSIGSGTALRKSAQLNSARDGGNFVGVSESSTGIAGTRRCTNCSMKAEICSACPRSMAYLPTHTAVAGMVSISSSCYARTGSPSCKSGVSNQGKLPAALLASHRSCRTSASSGSWEQRDPSSARCSTLRCSTWATDEGTGVSLHTDHLPSCMMTSCKQTHVEGEGAHQVQAHEVAQVSSPEYERRGCSSVFV